MAAVSGLLRGSPLFEAMRSSCVGAKGGGGPGAWAPFLRGDRLPVRVLVLPADRGGKALVVDRVGHGRPCAGALLPLLGVEGAPLGALVDVLLVDDEAAVGADQFAGLVGAVEV